MNKIARRVVLAAGVSLVFGAGTAAAQQVPVTYTDGQAGTGKAVYAQRCETCHGDTLQGLIEAPALTGRPFELWKGKPVKELYDFIRMYMPQDDPGKLSPEQYAAITAYILQFNKIPAGTAELPPNPPATMIIPK